MERQAATALLLQCVAWLRLNRSHSFGYSRSRAARARGKGEVNLPSPLLEGVDPMLKHVRIVRREEDGIPCCSCDTEKR